MTMDCIAWARMPTAAWAMPVAAQNKITRSCALRFGFAIARASSDLWDFCNARQMFSPSHIAGRISRFNVTRIQQYSGGEE